MAGTGSIWRDNNVEATAKAASEIIEFDTGATPDALSKFGEITIRIPAGLAFLKKPKGQINTIQDTFVKGVHQRIVGWIEDPVTAGFPDKSKIWGMEAKKTSTTFPHGRFGLRLDDFPDFNVRPNTNRGIVLGDIEWKFIAGEKYKAVFIFDAFFQANSTGINSPTFNWNTT